MNPNAKKRQLSGTMASKGASDMRLSKRNIECMCSTRAEIIHEIRRTVFHEVGHHFGLDEDDLVALGYE